MKIKAIVLDFDGTVANSLNEHYEAACAVFKRGGVKQPPSRDELFRSFTYPFTENYRRFGVLASKKEILDWYAEAYRYQDVKLFPDALKVLPLLIERAAVVITSASRQSEVAHILSRAGLGLNGDLKIVGDTPAKACAVIEVISAHRLYPAQVAFASDLDWDIQDVRQTGVVTVGISRGISTPDKLWAAGASHVAADLYELNTLLGILERQNR